MSFLGQFAQLGLFLFLIAPAIIVVLGVSWLELGGGEQSARRKLLVELAATFLMLACLDLLIWANPAGRRISSSFPAIGILPALVALLALLASKLTEMRQLWATDRILFAGLGLVGLVLAGLLWVGEPTTLYIVLALSVMLSLAWLAGTRASGLVLVGLSLVCLASQIFAGGGAFFTPGLDNPAWLLTVVQIIAGLSMVLGIFLSSAILFTSLQAGPATDRLLAGLRILLAVLLLAGGVYMVYWDGLWSSALSRVFEDHLPIAQFLLSVMSGTLLALSLAGWRKLAGLVFVFVICAVSIQALLWGWNTSAFTLTEQRAERVNTAIGRYYQAEGRYPEGLADLTPRYLIFLPPPVVVRLGGWCYQGGRDYYRLGYVSGEFTYQQAVFQAQLFAQTGELPDGGWNCDRMVEKFEHGGMNY
jgi:hypothetical protein